MCQHIGLATQACESTVHVQAYVHALCVYALGVYVCVCVFQIQCLPDVCVFLHGVCAQGACSMGCAWALGVNSLGGYVFRVYILQVYVCSRNVSPQCVCSMCTWLQAYMCAHIFVLHMLVPVMSMYQACVPC